MNNDDSNGTVTTTAGVVAAIVAIIQLGFDIHFGYAELSQMPELVFYVDIQDASNYAKKIYVNVSNVGMRSATQVDTIIRTNSTVGLISHNSEPGEELIDRTNETGFPTYSIDRMLPEDKLNMQLSIESTEDDNSICERIYVRSNEIEGKRKSCV